LKSRSATLRIVLHELLAIALFGSLLSLIATAQQAVATTPTCAQGGPCAIGDVGPGGGKVFYVAAGTFTQVGATGSMCSTDCKYLEAAPNGWSGGSTDPGITWAALDNRTTRVTDASGEGIGTGYRNSVAIVNQSDNLAADAAAVAAMAYRGGSKSDWFLPSKDELVELTSIIFNNGVFDSANWRGGWYWSSTELDGDGTEAVGKDITDYSPPRPSPKWEAHYVRPIRAFGLPGTPTKVFITRAPVRTLTPNTVFASQPQITIQDAIGRTVPSSAEVIATISAGGTLVGTTTATASYGVATFSNLGVNGTVGTTYTITYTAVGLTVATATVTLTGTNCDGSTTICQIGDFGPGGGLVFYVNTNGFRCGPTLSSVCRYLEAAREGWNGGSEDPRRTWASNTDPGLGQGNQGMIVTGAGARGTAIGTGYQNSVAIVSHGGNLPENSAAALARSYTGNNLTDWYLPSKNELREITIKQNLLAASAGYWSSSEISATKAWDEGNNYNQGQANKSSSTPVRPIRAFGTLTAISSAAIAGVTAPVTGATPVTAVTPGTGYTGTVSWSTTPSTFASLTTYTATITLTATAGYSLTGVNANFFTVSGATSVTHVADSGVITAVFPATAGLSQATLSITSLTASTKAFPYSQVLSISTTGGLGTGATTFAIATGGSASGCALSDATATATITATTIGTCLIQASKAADATYDATTSTAATFTFTKATQTITFATPTGMTVGGSTQTVAPTATSTLTVSLTSTTTGICTVAGFVITAVASGTCSITASQVGNANYEAGAEVIKSFGITGVISIAEIAGVTAPVAGATPVSTTSVGTGYTGSVSWSDSPATFAAATTYTATITLTATAGYTLTGVSANFFSVAGATTVTHNANSGVITAVFPATAATPTAPVVVTVAPTPVPYLKTLTTPKLNLKDGKLICTPGKYNAGYTFNSVTQGSTTTLFTPSSFTFNFLVNEITQTTLTVTTALSNASWNLPTTPSGAIISCSVTVSANGVTNTDKSTDNTSAVSSALSTQALAIAKANIDYSMSQSTNSKAYQKELVDNRAKWRSDIEKIRTDYYTERDRIKSLPSTRATRAQASAALKTYTTAQKKSAEDYRASKPAAAAARDAANKAALDAKNKAIAKANATYGTFIESIGYGVLIP
jgi:Skp family chaperone for outer membrane proteins